VARANKTQQNAASPEDFVASVENEARRTDAQKLLEWFEQVTGLRPRMWGPSIIGYGRYHYEYDSGRQGEFMLTGFSPRKSAISIYVMPGYRSDAMQDNLVRLGRHKLGKSCLYINKLDDVDLTVLRAIVEDGLAYMRDNYQTWDE
jgi:Domain of unknown function (DU1801)